MKHLTLFLLTLFLSSFTFAEFEIPNEFEDGQVTSASQMNENFQALKAQILAIKSQLDASAENNKETFVGVTEEKFDGSGGLLAMGKACDAMVKNSIICTRSIYRTSVKPEDIEINGNGWLLETQHNWGCYDFNSSTPSYSNVAITPDGKVTSFGCSSMLGVACCK